MDTGSSPPPSPLCAALHKYNRMQSKLIPGASSQHSSHPFKLYSKDSEGRAWQKQVYSVLSRTVLLSQAASSDSSTVRPLCFLFLSFQKHLPYFAICAATTSGVNPKMICPFL